MLEERDADEGTLHPLITQDRDTGNGYYVSAREYPCGNVEVVAMKLNSEQDLKRGGGSRRKNVDKSAMDDVTLWKSVARARTAVRRKCMAAGVDRLLTLTFRENLDDLDIAWNVFSYFRKLMKRRYKDFQYVCVPERQKRGAIHFHLGIAGYYHANTVRRLWRRAAGMYGGNIDITSPRTRGGKYVKNPKKIANYVSKYLTKTDDVEFNKRRYSSGGKIQLPDPERGWVPLGCSIVKLMREVIENRTRRDPAFFWESESHFGIYYAST